MKSTVRDTAPDRLYYEDFAVGKTFESGSYAVTAEEIRKFAAQYDPLPFHIDEDAARETMTGELTASGWHVLSMQMRLGYDGFLFRTASMGSFGMDEVKWLAPVRPGDVLTVKCAVFEKRVSNSRPEMGIIRFKWQLFDQNAELKSETVGSNLVQTRASIEGVS